MFSLSPSLCTFHGHYHDSNMGQSQEEEGYSILAMAFSAFPHASFKLTVSKGLIDKEQQRG